MGIYIYTDSTRIAKLYVVTKYPRFSCGSSRLRVDPIIYREVSDQFTALADSLCESRRDYVGLVGNDLLAGVILPRISRTGCRDPAFRAVGCPMRIKPGTIQGWIATGEGTVAEYSGDVGVPHRAEGGGDWLSRHGCIAHLESHACVARMKCA